jgi:hypothetical protein
MLVSLLDSHSNTAIKAAGVRLKTAQQQSLFTLLRPSDRVSAAFIEACDKVPRDVVITARDTRPGYEGKTLLHEAARLGCLAAVNLLIQIGHEIDCIDTCVHKVTPFMEAVRANHLEVADALQMAGASVHTIDLRGENVFHYAARTGVRICKLLVLNQELKMNDLRTALSARSVKRALPEDLAANPYIANMLRSFRETGDFVPPVRQNKRNI